MRYQCSIDIDLPRERVIALFDDQHNLKRWQPMLRSVEVVRGTPGEVGTVTRLTYRDGAREFVLTETVTHRALPERFAGSYEAPGMHQTVENRFEALGADGTRWTCDCEARFDALGMKLASWFAPGTFRKRTESLMRSFKDFAESQTDEGLERTQFESR